MMEKVHFLKWCRLTHPSCLFNIYFLLFTFTSNFKDVGIYVVIYISKSDQFLIYSWRIVYRLEKLCIILHLLWKAERCLSSVLWGYCIFSISFLSYIKGQNNQKFSYSFFQRFKTKGDMYDLTLHCECVSVSLLY